MDKFIMGTQAPRLKSISIDLDGTLLDTCEDLAVACNRTLAGFGILPCPHEEIRGFIGLGVNDLLSRCLRGSASLPSTHELVASFNRHYGETNGAYSTLYAGASEGLELLRSAGYVLSCVTNKPALFTLPLLRRFQLLDYFATVVPGDALAHMKPHPAPLLHACQAANSDPDQHAHIGDSRHDIEAAKAAGCKIYCVLYGYNAGQAIQDQDCDGLFPDLHELARWLIHTQEDQSDAIGKLGSADHSSIDPS